ncbi:hypothetical protein JNW88_20400 [Micromonospora sp. ATA32]|nr:hypothetical protein [Micromonospora sp. ATA32]
MHQGGEGSQHSQPRRSRPKLDPTEATRRCRIGDEHAKGQVMTSVGQRIKGFLNGPQGRKMIDRGRRQAAKPSTQEKLRQFAKRMTGGPSGRR